MKKIYIVMVSIALLSSGCKKSLVEVDNPSAYNYYTYFNSADRLNEGVIAAYAVFLHPGMYSRDYYYIFDLLGNDATIVNPPRQDLSEFQDYDFGKTNSNLGWLWASLYRMVLRANVVIDRAGAWNPSSNDDKESKKQFIAEAKFLRGYANFQLVTLWGRVPLRKSYDETINDQRPKRTDVNTIWAFIEQDLLNAIDSLPLRADIDLGRAHKGAAIALLGKVYLYQKKWPQARDRFKEIVNNKNTYGCDLSSVAAYDEKTGLFGQQNQDNEEIIFQVMHKKWEDGEYYYFEGNQETSEGRATHCARAWEYGFADDDGQHAQVSSSLASAFTYSVNSGTPSPDLRAGYFMYSNDPATGAKTTYYDNHPPGNPFPASLDGCWWKKYEYYEDEESYHEAVSGINSVVIRYADVLLMLAEAYIQTGSPDLALDRINEVRTRWGNVPYLTLGSQAMQILKRERQIELAGEQSRFFDLVRWGDLLSVLNQELRSQNPGLSSNPVKSYHILLPIPQQERNTNPFILEGMQNDWN